MLKELRQGNAEDRQGAESAADIATMGKEMHQGTMSVALARLWIPMLLPPCRAKSCPPQHDLSQGQLGAAKAFRAWKHAQIRQEEDDLTRRTFVPSLGLWSKEQKVFSSLCGCLRSNNFWRSVRLLQIADLGPHT